MDNNIKSILFIIKDAIYIVINIWDRISQQVIINCQKKTRILFFINKIKKIEQAFKEEQIDNFVFIERLFNKLPYNNQYQLKIIII